MTEQMTERQRRVYKRWTDEEIAYLTANAGAGVAAIAEALGRDKPNIYQKAKQLGVDVRRSKSSSDI